MTAAHLALLDVSAMAYKFWHGSAPGEALKGVCDHLAGLRAEPIAYLGAALDWPGPTFRNAILPTYKANRPPKPADVVQFLRDVRRAIDAFAIPTLQWPEHEADDAIASATAAAVSAGVSVSILSGDKDLWQLVQPGVSLVSRHRGVTTRYDEAAVVAKAGVRPQQIPDWLALAGDASDNIPGLDGIGAQRAAELLRTMGSVDAILAMPRGAIRAVPRVKRLALAVHDQAEAVRTYVKLTTLARGPVEIETLRPQPIDRWALAEFLEPVHPALLRQIRGMA